MLNWGISGVSKSKRTRTDSGFRRMALFLALSLGLTAALWGCGAQTGSAGIQDEQESPDRAERTIPSSGIDAPLRINYTVANPLIIDEVREEDGQDYDYVYLTVKGLKDQGIQQKINARIKEVYDELRVQDLPPYRGVKIQVPAGYAVASERVYASVMGSFNNILSVMFDKTAVWQPAGAEGDSNEKAFYDTARYVSEIETLNFDLNTGEEFKLGDLFCDNVEPMELLNGYMSRFLSKSGADDEVYRPGVYSGNMKLVESFKGLSKEQKFGIYPFGISLVFDYNTPQFETGCTASSTVVNFSELGDVLALTKRFYNEEKTKSLFASTEPAAKSLVARDEMKDIAGDESGKEGGINIYRSWRYSSELPVTLRNELERMIAVDQDALAQIRREYEALSRPDSEGFYEIYVSSGQYGNYINTSRSVNSYLIDQYRQQMEYHCYDSDTLEELELKDIFKEGYDYKPVVVQAIKEALNYTESEETIEEISAGISGFNLSSDEIYIPITQPKKDINTYGLSLYIPYTKFGCDNLEIFR